MNIKQLNEEILRVLKEDKPMKYPVYFGKDNGKIFVTHNSLDFDKYKKEHPQAKTWTERMTEDEYYEKYQNKNESQKNEAKFKKGDKVKFHHGGGRYSNETGTIIDNKNEYGYDLYTVKWSDGEISTEVSEVNLKKVL